MLNLTELMDIGCAQTVVDSDGWMYPCGKTIVAIRRWPDGGDGESFGGVCQWHAKQAGAELVPLKNIPLPFCKTKTMTTNVTEKVIDWCEKHVTRIDEKIPNASDEGFLAGERFALQAVAAHCEELLGYSGSMPLEVPNQSEKESR